MDRRISRAEAVCLHFYQPLKLSNIMTYDQEIRSSKVVLMEFYASWCPHCQRMMPVVAQVKELLDGRANVCQLDIDNNKEAADAADVRSIPSFLIYVDGEEAWRHTGEIDGEVLLSKIESFL
ncbi:thioredoxin family protein [Duncaniella muris]|uniref:thioredoxin family protein n=1 Tax=Duncaniella muris TaxID=2094150 RepID=UPI0030C72DBA